MPSAGKNLQMIRWDSLLKAMVLHFAGKRKTEIVNNCKPIDKPQKGHEDLAIYKKLAEGGRIMEKKGR